MTPLFQRHLSAEKTLFELEQACLELAHQLDDVEKKASAYAQAEKYRSMLRDLQDFLIC